MVPRIIKTEAVCGTMFRTLLAKQQKGSVLSAFDRAVNVETPDGIITVLSRGRNLQPFSCRTLEPFFFSETGWKPGTEVLLDGEGISVGDQIRIDFAEAAIVDLTIEEAFRCSGYRFQDTDASPVLSVLKEIGDENGLSNLAADLATNVYADLIRPRLPELYHAVSERDTEAATKAVQRIAGCGVGLTPSSDDLLSGYFTVLQAAACGDGDDALKDLIREAAEAAAEKTNRISGTFLKQVGKGMASEDVLNLLKLIFSNTDAERICSAARRVAAFGSTSGTDTLTGIALAIINHNGGKNSGKTGNQEKRLL